MFEVKKLFTSARSCTIEMPDGGLYNTKRPYQLTLNGEAWGTADTVVAQIETLILQLQPAGLHGIGLRIKIIDV